MSYRYAPYPPNNDPGQEARERAAIEEIRASLLRADWFAREVKEHGVGWWQVQRLAEAADQTMALATALGNLFHEQLLANATPEQMDLLRRQIGTDESEEQDGTAA